MEAIDVEVEKVVRRIEALDGTDANFPAHAGGVDSLHPENAVAAGGQVPNPGLEPKPADASTVGQLSISDDLSIPKFLRREQARPAGQDT